MHCIAYGVALVVSFPACEGEEAQLGARRAEPVGGAGDFEFRAAREGMGEGQQRKVVLEPRGFSGVAVRRRHIPEGDSLGPYTDYHVLVGENLRTGE